MILLCLATLLPGLLWDQGPETAETIKRAGTERLYVPAANHAGWELRGFHPISVSDAMLQSFKKLPTPGVRYEINVASATRVPWVDANGWRIQRAPAGVYYYDLPRGSSALAAAEAYSYDADSVLHIDPSDLDSFGSMLAFLRKVDQARLPLLANLAVIDDGSSSTGEFLNLLARHNLLFRLVSSPDPGADLTIQIGSSQYPKRETQDPRALVQKVRQQLTDVKRLLRIYGSDVVLGRLTGDRSRARLYLLNYVSVS